MLSFFSSSPSLLVGSPAVRTSRASALQMATVGETLKTMQGPEIFWGPEGPLQDPMKEESDLKEYDTFSKFLDACAANGVDLSAPGITVLAPANVACTEYEANGGVLSKEICEYHIVKGEVSSDGLGNADLMTVEGSKITYRRMFRKNFLDNAMCGVKAKTPCDPNFCNDVKCDNGVIHGLTEVIYPGWSESAGGYGSEGDVAATR